jgi:hypothetical protein
MSVKLIECYCNATTAKTFDLIAEIGKPVDLTIFNKWRGANKAIEYLMSKGLVDLDKEKGTVEVSEKGSKIYKLLKEAAVLCE